MPNVNGGSPNGNSGRAHRDGQALAVGTQIRERREAQGTSLRALARECDMSPAHLSKIERGLSRPSLETLTRLVQRLDLYDLNLFAGVSPAVEGQQG